MHLQFLQPLQGGIGAAMRRFTRVMTVEANWSDRREDALVNDDNRRYSALATLLRARYLVDVDCWSEVRGQPIKPGTLKRVLAAKLDESQIPTKEGSAT
jgi:2-oxoglutarate ferredoxin oxidoreductase subunit alpha